MLGDTPKAKKRRNRVKDVATRGRLWKHSTLADIDGMISPGEIAEMFCFTLVRNPWDRMVSLYFYLWHNLGRHREKLGDKTFAEFVDHIAANQPLEPVGPYNWLGLSQANPQTAWTHDGNERRMQFIGRYEHLADDWAFVCKVLGIDTELPLTNTTNHRPYQEYYTPALRDTVGEIYERDVSEWGYEF